jgi:hypothetical protein
MMRRMTNRELAQLGFNTNGVLGVDISIMGLTNYITIVRLSERHFSDTKNDISSMLSNFLFQLILPN